MPELPEVETTRRGLEPHITGARIETMQVFRRDLRQPIPKTLEKTMIGARFLGVRRRAKYLLFDMDNGQVVLAHLGMSGTFTLVPHVHYKKRTHDHVLITLDNGLYLVFHDPRRFGVILLLQALEEASHPLLAHLGPEPLSNHFNASYLRVALAKKTSPIKVALMDQEVVVGVGNIYASESLFLAGIHPRMKASDAASHAEQLVPIIRCVLTAAIASGGSTLRDYVRSSGDAGYFQHEFNVYDREGESCIVCSEPITRIVQANRSTFFCARCQPLSTKKTSRKT